MDPAIRDHLRRAGIGQMAGKLQTQWNDALVPAGTNEGTDIWYHAMTGFYEADPARHQAMSANAFIDGMNERIRISNEHPHGGLSIAARNVKVTLVSQEELARKGLRLNEDALLRNPVSDTVERDVSDAVYWGSRQ